MPKWCKTIVAILLLPLCAGGAVALTRVVRASAGAETVWVATLAGAGCWGVIFLLLPKPMWVYVVGHELTHAVWTWMLGGQVKKFRASASGGHVIVTKNNFLIALAPYFFPLYALLVAAAYVGGSRVWRWEHYRVWFHLLLGMAYAFHVTLTWEVLKTNQTDITEQGYLFSAVVIFLGNLSVLLVAIPLLAAGVDLATAFQWWGAGTWRVLAWLATFW